MLPAKSFPPSLNTVFQKGVCDLPVAQHRGSNVVAGAWSHLLSLPPHQFFSCSLVPSEKKINLFCLPRPAPWFICFLFHRCLSIKRDALIYLMTHEYLVAFSSITYIPPWLTCTVWLCSFLLGRGALEHWHCWCSGSAVCLGSISWTGSRVSWFLLSVIFHLVPQVAVNSQG